MPPRRPADNSAAPSSTNERNQYIPSFITKKPFFLESTTSSTDDYLEHQRLHQQQPSFSSKNEDRSKRILFKATKYRKGACQNCGAMGHVAKDCLQRTRKEGARWTGRDILPDEDRNAKEESNWDAKRDQYATYDPSEYINVVEEFEQMEKLRKARAASMTAGITSAAAGTVATTATKEASGEGAGTSNLKRDGSAEPDTADGIRYEEETDMGRNQPTSTRNLRIREDVAPYLRSLDPDSAKYDPKSRRMLDAGALADQAAELVAEQGFMRASGAREEFERAQRLAWETQKGTTGAAVVGLGSVANPVGIPGDRIHLQANPTHAQKLIEMRDKEAAERREKRKRELLEEYGGASYFTTPLLNVAKPDGGSATDTATTANSLPNQPGSDTSTTKAVPKIPNVIESDRFIEYDPETGLPKLDNPDGKTTEDGKGKPRPRRKSRYPEDVLINNHTSVWGSWWFDFQWGYKCCYSTVKNSYCTGQAGREVWMEDRRRKLGLLESGGDGEGDGENGQREGHGKEEERVAVSGKGGGRDAAEEDESRPRKRIANFDKFGFGHSDEHEKMMDEYRKDRMRADDPLWRAP